MAISEPRFRVAYANMCRCLSMFKVPGESKQGDVSFRTLLLTRCQREFDMAFSSKTEFDFKRKQIEKTTMEEEKQQMTEELEYDEMKFKMRSLGNVRFIGELFKLRMLTENIMHDCVFKLLRTKYEENLECLCGLLKTIGKELDTDKTKPRMDQYIAHMQKKINDTKLSPRVLFMLQDVIELRQNKWVPMRNDQFDRELANEEKNWSIFVQNSNNAKLQKRNNGKHLGQPSGPISGEADHGNTVSLTQLKTNRSIDSTKQELPILGNSDSENIQFCDFDGGARFSAFGKADKPEDDGSRIEGGREGLVQPKTPYNSPSPDSEREKAIAVTKTSVVKNPAQERSCGFDLECIKALGKPSSSLREVTDNQIKSKIHTIIDDHLPMENFRRLEFTKEGNGVSIGPTTSMPIPKIEEILNNLIIYKNCSNEEVFDWIEGHMDGPTTKQQYFIRSLMTAVCRSAVKIVGKNLLKVDKSQMQRRNSLLQKYLDQQENFELQALFALQAVVHKLEHPPGLLRELFEILYDEDIICESVFIQWEKSEDPQEQEGKDEAIKQVAVFLKWMKEAEDDV